TELAQIWAGVLKLDRVGRHDHFFELGGHSLLAVTLIERMRKAGLHTDIRSLFNTPTLAALAKVISTNTNANVVEIPPNLIPAQSETITPDMLSLVKLSQEEIDRITQAVPGGAANVQDIYPLVPLQEGILFHHLMTKEGDPYLLYRLARFSSRSKLDRYLEAMQSVIDRHDTLRTAIQWEGLSEPVQVVWRQALLRIEEVELEETGEDAGKRLLARFHPRHYRIAVSQAPLKQIFIAHDRADGNWVMLDLFHHLVGDHSTMEVEYQEIQSYLLGREAELAAPLPFRNFVAQAKLGVSREVHQAFFTDMLGDVDEPTAPFGLLDIQGDGGGIVESKRMVAPDVSKRLRQCARTLGVSAASICHLAWAQVLSKVSGRDDVVFGTVLFGRMQGGEGADKVMGLFINTLPIRIRLDDCSAQDGVYKTHRLLTQLMHHEHAPLVLAQRCSGVAAPMPLFSSVLNYRHNAGVDLNDSKAESAVQESQFQTAWEGIEFLESEERTNYPFTLSVDDFGDEFGLDVQVHASLDPQRICGLMHCALEGLITALEKRPQTAISKLGILPEQERYQILEEWNSTQAHYPQDKCIHALFEEQVV
ncbi:condensation domain-containing protein, partial [Undibacterium pigrum]|uniref:condensation domain-containing protein n=1 Tax=Undibacterium pigrum TaxID=401470 RepID=UPI001FEC304A